MPREERSYDYRLRHKPVWCATIKSMELPISSNEKIMVVDAETDGLYGDFVSIGAVVYDDQLVTTMFNGVWMKETFNDSWADEHVKPILLDAKDNLTTYSNEEDLMNAFWDFYSQHRETCRTIGYTIYPVECRLFQRCVEKNLEERRFQGPYPLYDLASMAPNELLRELTQEYYREQATSVQHNHIEDCKATAHAFFKLGQLASSETLNNA